MLKPGMILDERYEIVDVVGSGGMSIVYKAKDHRLKRYVALKVLKTEFSSDANFVSKFRVEAQSSAGLTHPNIVSVFDVCEDEGFHFIVMELVEGITLKEYISLNGRLNMDQAIDFSIQIASGLEAAHENHVIHRDIKPQNIIVSKNGNLKVTDFGIAKAATSNTMSTTGMGSVHYISPEQARGGYSDERSDIYSLGITMYEMVTGRVPFEGDTNVSIALMHIQNDIIPPRQFYPDIYSSFEKIILKATQKKPERRYLTASALIADLKRVKANPNIDIIVAPQGVTNAPTQQFTAADMQAIKNGSAVKNNSSLNTFETPKPYEEKRSSVPQPGSERLNQLLSAEDDYEDEDDYVTPQPPVRRTGIKKVEDDYDDDDYDDYDSKRSSDDVDPKLEKAIMAAGVAVAVIIAVIVFIVFGNIMGWFKFGKKTTETTEDPSATEEQQMVPMIDVTGYSQEAADRLLKEAGFTNYTFEIETNEEVEANYVIRQSVDKGEMITTDQELIIYVSGGAEKVVIPSVVNLTNDEATALLESEKYGFKVKHSFEASDEIEKDKVISIEPAENTEVAKGSTVNIVISNGPDVKTVAVPKVTGISESAARSSLEALKLAVGNVSHENSDTVEKGLVIRQSIAEGTEVNEGTSVDIVISDGKKEVKYTGSVSGSISISGNSQEAIDYINAASSVTVEVYLNAGNATYTLYQNTLTGATSFPLTVSGSEQNLSVREGTVSFRVIDNDTQADITSYFTSSLSSSFSPQ